MEIRDRRLYRQDFACFEEYCQSPFTLTRRSLNYLIAASSVVKNLLRTKANNFLGTNGFLVLSFVLPTSERQVRPLAKLEPQKQVQVEVWHRAKDLVSDGKAFCCEIPYKYVFEIAAHSLAAITQKLPSDELVKSVLQLAEHWAIASNGELVLIEQKRKPEQWYPLCLVESENPQLAY